jgi:hypothetical protein
LASTPDAIHVTKMSRLVYRLIQKVPICRELLALSPFHGKEGVVGSRPTEGSSEKGGISRDFAGAFEVSGVGRMPFRVIARLSRLAA